MTNYFFLTNKHIKHNKITQILKWKQKIQKYVIQNIYKNCISVILK